MFPIFCWVVLLSKIKNKRRKVKGKIENIGKMKKMKNEKMKKNEKTDTYMC